MDVAALTTRRWMNHESLVSQVEARDDVHIILGGIYVPRIVVVAPANCQVFVADAVAESAVEPVTGCSKPRMFRKLSSELNACTRRFGG